MALSVAVAPAIVVEELGPIAGRAPVVVARCAPLLARARHRPAGRPRLPTCSARSSASCRRSSACSSASSGAGCSLALGAILTALVTQPIVAIVATLQYFDPRIRFEGFDLQVIAAELGRHRCSASLTSAVPGTGAAPGRREAADEILARPSSTRTSASLARAGPGLGDRAARRPRSTRLGRRRRRARSWPGSWCWSLTVAAVVFAVRFTRGRPARPRGRGRPSVPCRAATAGRLAGRGRGRTRRPGDWRRRCAAATGPWWPTSPRRGSSRRSPAAPPASTGARSTPASPGGAPTSPGPPSSSSWPGTATGRPAPTRRRGSGSSPAGVLARGRSVKRRWAPVGRSPAAARRARPCSSSVGRPTATARRSTRRPPGRWAPGRSCCCSRSSGPTSTSRDGAPGDDDDVALVLRRRPRRRASRDDVRGWVEDGGTLVVADPPRRSSRSPVSGTCSATDRPAARRCDVPALADVERRRPVGGVGFDVPERARAASATTAAPSWPWPTSGRGTVVAVGGAGAVHQRRPRRGGQRRAGRRPARAREPGTRSPSSRPAAGRAAARESLGRPRRAGRAGRRCVQLAVAFVVYALWRARRLGRPVPSRSRSTCRLRARGRRRQPAPAGAAGRTRPARLLRRRPAPARWPSASACPLDAPAERGGRRRRRPHRASRPTGVLAALDARAARRATTTSSPWPRRADGRPPGGHPWSTVEPERPDRRRAGACATRSPRSWSARTACCPASSPPCSCGATCCSRACPAWPRRCWSRRWPPPSTSSSSGCSSRPTSCRPTSLGQLDPRAGGRGFRFRRGPGVHQPAARRRDQPHAAEDPGGAARGHGGAAGHRRGRGPAAARAVRRRRHPEPGRVRGHLPAARGPARPVPVQAGRAATRPPSRSRRCSPATTPGLDPHDLGAAGRRGRWPARPTWRPAGAEVERASGARPPVLAYIVALARATRESPSLSLGVSPRGAAMLLHAAKAWAWLAGGDLRHARRGEGGGQAALRHRIAAAPRARARGRHRRRRPRRHPRHRPRPPVASTVPGPHPAGWRVAGRAAPSSVVVLVLPLGPARSLLLVDGVLLVVAARRLVRWRRAPGGARRRAGAARRCWPSAARARSTWRVRNPTRRRLRRGAGRRAGAVAAGRRPGGPGSRSRPAARRRRRDHASAPAGGAASTSPRWSCGSTARSAWPPARRAVAAAGGAAGAPAVPVAGGGRAAHRPGPDPRGRPALGAGPGRRHRVRRSCASTRVDDEFRRIDWAATARAGQADRPHLPGRAQPDRAAACSTTAG